MNFANIIWSSGISSCIIFSVVSIIASKSLESDQFCTVQTKNGLIRGIQNRSLFEGQPYFSFRGIPFAEPPIDHLRFKVKLKWIFEYFVNFFQEEKDFFLIFFLSKLKFKEEMFIFFRRPIEIRRGMKQLMHLTLGMTAFNPIQRRITIPCGRKIVYIWMCLIQPNARQWVR